MHSQTRIREPGNLNLTAARGVLLPSPGLPALALRLRARQNLVDLRRQDEIVLRQPVDLVGEDVDAEAAVGDEQIGMVARPLGDRSEERRVGKECRCWWSQ